MTKCIKHPDQDLKPVGSGKNIRHKCQVCNKEYQAKWWKANKETQLKRVKANTKRHLKRIRSYVIEYLKAHPCIDCGISDIEVLEFDHREPKEKRGNVCALIQRGFPLETVKNEILKCDIRCANCHRRKTRIQFGYLREDKPRKQPDHRNAPVG